MSYQELTLPSVLAFLETLSLEDLGVIKQAIDKIEFRIEAELDKEAQEKINAICKERGWVATTRKAAKKGRPARKQEATK